jgi:hypothetical protein
MMVGPNRQAPANDEGQAMLEHMAKVQIEEAVAWRTRMEWAKTVAPMTKPRTKRDVTRFLCEQSCSHYTLAFLDPRWSWRLRPNVSVLGVIGQAVADAAEAERVMGMMAQAAMEEKIATAPTVQ